MRGYLNRAAGKSTAPGKAINSHADSLPTRRVSTFVPFILESSERHGMFYWDCTENPFTTNSVWRCIFQSPWRRTHTVETLMLILATRLSQVVLNRAL